MARSTLAFLHVAKTGGRTVDTVLRGTYGGGYILAEPLREPRPVGTGGREFLLPTYGPDDYRWLRRRIPWLRAIGGHTLTLWSGLHEVEPVRYVAFLREPLARAASHYQFHVNTTPAPLDWEAWCAWPEHHDHQVRFFDPEGRCDQAIAAIQTHGVFVGLLERFEESLLLLRQLVAPELRCAYQRSNTARSNELARSLLADPQRCEEMRAMYAGEFPLYAWVRDELWPRYVAAYEGDLAADAARLRADPAAGYRRRHDRVAWAVHHLWVAPWQRLARRR
jgi:hypothetical protein